MRTLFWDVDTQADFMEPDGAMYVEGAAEIVERLARLTEWARLREVMRGGSVSFHSPDDSGLSSSPDLEETYPLHCVAGTPGAAKIPATRPKSPLWVPSRQFRPEALADQIAEHRGEVIVQKKGFDVFSNPNTSAILDALAPDRVVVYGVALDVACRLAIDGFLRREGTQVWLVEDATKASRPADASALLKRFRKRGVKIVATEEILAS